MVRRRSRFGTTAARRNTDRTDVMIGDVDRDDMVSALASYSDGGKAGVRRAQSTLATFSTALRAFLSWCVDTEKISRSPMAKVKQPKTPTRALSAEQCQRIIDTARASRTPERDTLAVLLGLAMGLRLSEIASIRLDSLQPTQDAPSHLQVVGKGDKGRSVPVPGVVRDAIAAWLPVRTAQLVKAGATPEHAACLAACSGGRHKERWP